ncbi:MAG TPA: hypothetical protein PLK55_00175 [archaeon]|nr:hypothetical protein [archaeon]
MHRLVKIRKPPVNAEIKIVRHRVTTEKLDSSNFNSSFISELKFSKDAKGKPLKIGEGLHEQFLGTIIFKDGSKKRVAIKRFNELLKLDDFSAKKYQHVIDALRQIELEHDVVFPNRQIGKAKMIPKMAMVKIQEKGKDPEWVLVSQAFVKNGKSKLKPNNDVIINKLNISEYTWGLLKLGESGFMKESSLGLVADLFAHHKSGSLIPIDMDFAQLIDFKKRDRNTRANDILRALSQQAQSISKNKDNINSVYKTLVIELLKHKMDPKVKDLLISYRKKYLIK